MRGLLAVFFGLLVLFWAGLTLTSFTLIFAVFAVSEALLLMIAGRNPASDKREWSLLLEGIAGASLGICAFLLPAFLSLIWPDVATTIMLVLMASWALVTGFIEISSALRLRKEIKKEWKFLTCGILSILLAVVLLIRLKVEAFTVRWTIGVYLVVFGVLLIFATYKARNSRAPSS
jgi:uncharacterized membrane protein HdeD (DUF308 family)